MYDQLVNLISALGFPIAVSVYLLISVGTKLDSLINNVQKLEEDISNLIKYQREK
ncbi:YvrJ family protein [Clostridium tyrobutyricum]|jgi:hypothetical protein|uniref:YvrJ family protein n=1 Tax=Clostridium tyrobutyricum TaxID=1519 RepID=UPI00030765AF|nr:YvrJ family protein [Clostridium tyrobutyricum]MBR9647365.1 YvrJ family protein [Clostridium tyrobutyricum]MBV4416458.1 YvrJ family protein [Clostridium tyrobutyricum]MBV4417862.1 YvrJ family protein [Clostridium tyrobutyricum]MBV4423038.1 YvrJ family protein [Clostridium tyrobutyricum]MBV4425181.1 YvrJ family protein [Clostridium tyrobutyricum]